MSKIRQGLNLKQSPKYPGLVIRFLEGHQVLYLVEGHHLLDPLLWESILENIKVLEYLEADLSASMKKSSLIQSDLSVSGQSTLYIFFTLETKA
jgi:hypothetical protein